MSSYHSSFTYLKKNSSGEGFAIASFEPDSGFVDSYLGMDQVFTDSYDGTKKHFYGNKYNTSAAIVITLVKPDGTDFSMADNRRALKWLTGSRQASWLDLYVGDKLVYSFYGNITACQQHKFDARIIGIQVTFTSIHPWAWSSPQSFSCYIGAKQIDINESSIVYPTYETFEYFGVDDNGVVYNSNDNESFAFNISTDGIVYNDNSVVLDINNPSDDLYTLTNLDMTFKNINSTSLIIDNKSLSEKHAVIQNINRNEVISLSSGQFIISHDYTLFVDSINSSLSGTYYVRKWRNENEENDFIYQEINLPDNYSDIFMEYLVGDGTKTTFENVVLSSQDFVVQINGKKTYGYSYDKSEQTLSFVAAPEQGAEIEIFCNIYTFGQNLNKIFGDDFNFIWPQLQPGMNQFYIDGTGEGYVEFSYRYPIKIGDCAIDVDSFYTNPVCEGDISGLVGSSDGITTLARKNIILSDKATNTPYIAYIKDSYLYTGEYNNNRNKSIVFIGNKEDTLYEITINNTGLYLSKVSKYDGNMTARKTIILVDEVTGIPYELIVKDDYLHLSEI